MSIATVFFRDLQYVIIIAMQGFFFLTPILYKPDSLAGKVAWLVSLNPVTPFIQLFRAPLVEGILPSASVILQAIIIATISMLIGLFIFLREEKNIVFRL
jgi:ABC-type polysaccharide/polyol phosphate export permease